ncbi:unnamed protein product [Didymodactylos carnosus]|uniref:Peptidase C1A papain C-terminal domain-containing protein n=1 Tax=Didymodactylos carnosus TaxID=1234261 RepID=A0A816CTB4_9BILA|nr:unnamed protein product [Didymodactylos carnosus]CAF4519880.1 unnamed protein product [Didymodactylos carnosus]
MHFHGSRSGSHLRYPQRRPPKLSAIPRSYVPDDESKYRLRPWVDLRPWMSSVEDQEAFEDCTAEAIAGALEYLLMRYHSEDLFVEFEGDVSRRFILWAGTKIINAKARLVDKKNNTWITEAIYGLVASGFCSEKLWPHTIEYPVPSKKAVAQAKSRLPPNASRKGLSWGPQRDRYHVVLVVGYDDRTELFCVRNSWSQWWGFGGYFYIPYEYLVDSKFMQHASNGIWAIYQIQGNTRQSRKHPELLRLNNESTGDPFISSPLDPNVDLPYWEQNRRLIDLNKRGR